MLEYPEIRTIIKQMENEIIGKTVESGAMVKHNNNMFMNEGHVDQYSLLSDGTIIEIDCLAPDIYIRLDNVYGILICQSGGKILYNRTISEIPKNYNIIFKFTDGGSIYLVEQGHNEFGQPDYPVYLILAFAGSLNHDFI